MSTTHEDSAIAGLNLDPIKVKLMHEASGEGWTLERCDSVEFEYRRFLYLMKKFPNEQTAPLSDVDIFWHYHILDTAKYARDCEEVFGYFLHHFPYIGLRGEDDMEAHHRVGERMRELYEETFSEPYDMQRATAFSGAATGAAFSGATSAIAFSGAAVAAHPAEAKVAFSGATAAVAFSGASVAAPRGAPAFSGAHASTAFSGATAQVAFSGASLATAFSGAARQMPGDDFYATRPVLSRPA